MTIIIYLDETKKTYRVIRPKTWSNEPKENFDGNVAALVEHVTKSDRSCGIRNYHSYEVIN